MKFLVDVRITDREAAKPYLPAHLEYLNRHFENGDFYSFRRLRSWRGRNADCSKRID